MSRNPQQYTGGSGGVSSFGTMNVEALSHTAPTPRESVLGSAISELDRLSDHAGHALARLSVIADRVLGPTGCNSCTQPVEEPSCAAEALSRRLGTIGGLIAQLHDVATRLEAL